MKASLRRIAAEASVTTGAIYGCFQVKKPYSRALTGGVSQTLVDMYTNVHREFAVLSPEKQVEELSGITSHHVLSMINYIYDHFDEFKLLLSLRSARKRRGVYCPSGRGGGTVLFRLCGGCKKLGISGAGAGRHAGSYLLPILFQRLQEFISRDLPRERALSCALLLGRFQHAGWAGILNL